MDMLIESHNVVNDVVIMCIHGIAAVFFYMLIFINAWHDARTQQLYVRITNWAIITALVRLIALWPMNIGANSLSELVVVGVLPSLLIIAMACVYAKRGVLGRGDVRLLIAICIWSCGTLPGSFMAIVVLASAIQLVVFIYYRCSLNNHSYCNAQQLQMRPNTSLRIDSYPFGPQLCIATIVNDLICFLPLFAYL